MAQTVDLWGATYNNVPAITVPSGNSTATFTDVTDTTAVASDVAQGTYFYTAQGVRTEGTASGSGTVIVNESLDPGGGTIVEITAEVLRNQAKSFTPDETGATITPDNGYTGLSQVVVSPISSTYVGTGITRRSSTDLSASGATVTVPAGYYSSQATTSVSSGTAGTPTASKGTVNNHSISVTPSVTNTTGYITGSTKTGTAVTVTASELVSGSQTITSNSTVDVTNLASVTVAIPIVTYYTGSSAPSSSLGSNGDIYLQT